MNDIETIHARHSTRSFAAARPLEQEHRAALLRALEGARRGPFGGEVSIALVDVPEEELGTARATWTYGMISGARSFLVGSVASPKATVDFGHCFERVILEATRLGLGTCWLGGTFRHGVFAAQARVPDGHLIPCVSPVGYSSGKRTLTERALRVFAGAAHRQPFGALFFSDARGTPLTPATAGAFAEPLECVRLAPSAANKQPWRVVLAPGEKQLHFGLARRPVYDRSISEVSLQEVDLGIAISHFELACRQLGLSGAWSREVPAGALPGGVEPIASWQAQ